MEIKTTQKHTIAVSNEELKAIRIALAFYKSDDKYYPNCTTSEKQTIEYMLSQLNNVLEK